MYGTGYGGAQSGSWGDEIKTEYPVATASKPAGGAAPTRKRTVIEEDEDVAVPRSGTATSSSPFGEGSNYRIAVPVKHYDLASARTIPRNVKDAVITLLDANRRDITLVAEVEQQLRLYLSYIDELTVVDPLVMVFHTVKSETDAEGKTHCKIYLEEVVPFSDLILARVMKISLPLQITTKARTAGDEIKFTEIGVASYLGVRRNPEGVQPCGLSAAVVKRLQERKDGEEIEIQVNGHMTALGPIKPEDAAEANFIMEQEEVFMKIVAGSYRPVVLHDDSEKKLKLLGNNNE